ncbi:MAG: hypothetical protein WEG36_15280 [Gemmatimonadota bacterium]
MAGNEGRDHDWVMATWEGSRRAQLRRALRLTVRERLQALEALSEASARLVEAGRQGRAGGGAPPASIATPTDQQAPEGS